MDNIEYIEMQPEYRQQVEELITAAMNEDEGRWASKTFDFHFDCLQKGIDSTRQFYIALINKRVIGVVGLHQYRWGPEENIWLSWFAVSPDQQRKGIGKWLFLKMLNTAQQQGYRKIFIETYQNATFEKAISFYQQQGFREQGRVAGYLPDGSDMLVFQLDIGANQE
jgi:ribosomal protein S18 acetylase RimI-like enzyme